jgi:hypothetical protein
MTFSGSITSMRSGPQVVSMRSPVRARDARTTRCSAASATSRKASWTPRLAYWPMPKTQKISSLLAWALKYDRS